MERHTTKRSKTKRSKTYYFNSLPKVATNFYLPDECWVSIFKFILSHNDTHNRPHFKSLSLVSKQFLSITNRLRCSLTIHYDSERWNFPRLSQRFTNLVSLDLSYFTGDINVFLNKICVFGFNLTSLNVSRKPTIPADGLRAFSKKITTLTSLTCSDITSINGSDLFLIADCFPLLEELDLCFPNILENHESLRDGLKALSSILLKLRKVNLTNHYYMNYHSLFHVFNNLKHLEEAVITNIGHTINSVEMYDPILDAVIIFQLKNSVEKYNPLKDVVVNPQLKSLYLAYNNQWLRDESIEIFVSLFPNLEVLNLNRCCKISEEGICHVLKRCRKIRHLDLSNCSKIKLHRLNFEVPKLELLNLSHTRVDDETLYVISKSCRGILRLLLEYCWDVTENGVKHVVQNCRQLREINLKGCPLASCLKLL